MFRVSAIACSSATDFLFSSAISTCALAPLIYGGGNPGVGNERVENGFREFEGVRQSYSRVPLTPSQGRAVDLSAFLVAWRTTSLPDREVVDALVHPAHAGPSPALAAVLAHWPGSYYWSDEPDGRHLILTRPLARRRERWGLHVGLFLATLLTTTFAGAVVAGAVPLAAPLSLFTGSYPLPPHLVSAWAAGLSFSPPLLAIHPLHEHGPHLSPNRCDIHEAPKSIAPV